MITIERAVGDNASNKPVDVIKIQDLLNNNTQFIGADALMEVNGTVDDKMIGAIRTFQEKHPGIKAKRPDGVVSPGGNTLRRLAQCMGPKGDYKSRMPRGFDAVMLAQFNVSRFVDLYVRQYDDPALGAAATTGLKDLLDFILADADVTDLRWAAYMLATVKHECANTWLPIEETGKGAGKDYGSPVAVKIDNKTVQRIYYGRGYVQLTWHENYVKMDKHFGFTGEDSLELYPENALDPETAYDLMSYGMRAGTITGVGLPRYIRGARADYFNARQIILSHDKAELIAGYARNIEFLLRFCNGVPVAVGP